MHCVIVHCLITAIAIDIVVCFLTYMHAHA